VNSSEGKGESTMNIKHIESSTSSLSGITNEYHRKIALIAGFSLLVGTISIILAQVVAMAGIVIDGDTAITIENILANQGRFRLGITGFLIMAIVDLVVAWALYVFLAPADENISLLAAWFRVVYTIVFGIVIADYYSVAQLLGNEGVLSTLATPEIQTQVALSLGSLHDTWDIGYVFFGLHLLVLGIVAFRSGFVPKVFGIILLLGGASYLLDYTGLILFPDFGVETSLIFGFGELIFMLWLLFRGGKAELPTRR
jgi:hypothetical protein